CHLAYVGSRRPASNGDSNRRTTAQPRTSSRSAAIDGEPAGSHSTRARTFQRIAGSADASRPSTMDWYTPRFNQLSEGERVGLRAGLAEGDLQGAGTDPAALADQLIQAAVREDTGAVPVDVHAVRPARRLPVEAHPERDRRRLGGGQHQMRVPGVEAERDAPAGLPQPDLLVADRPVAGERPVV